MKPHALTIALFLLLGAIANVVVAWSCCLLQFQTQPTRDWASASIATMEVEVGPDHAQRVIDAGARVLNRDERSRLIAVGWQPSEDPWWTKPGTPDRHTTSFQLMAYNQRCLGASWRTVNESQSRGCMILERECAEQARAGLPMASLFGQRINPSPPGEPLGPYKPPAWEKHGAFVWTKKGPRGSLDEVLFPYAPIWPGFAINTLLYATILWMLFAAPFALRRRIRIRRGRVRMRVSGR